MDSHADGLEITDLDSLQQWMNKSTRQSGVKASSKSRDGHIGCPLSWFRLVFQVVRSKNELAVALHIYRLRSIRHSRTVAVSNAFLTELGIDPHAKYRALDRLEAAGIITVRRRHKQTIKVTFRDRKRAKGHGHARP
jgi:hypothetical protein